MFEGKVKTTDTIYGVTLLHYCMYRTGDVVYYMVVNPNTGNVESEVMQFKG